MDDIRVARPQDHILLREGDEWVRKVFRSEKINFVTSTLAGGGSSTLDPGHKNADEICYLIRGTLVIYFPERGLNVELRAGDAVLIPAGEPHQVFNPGKEESESVWCGAPGTDFRPMVRPSWSSPYTEG